MEAVRPLLVKFDGSLMLLGTPSVTGPVGPLWDAWNNKAFSKHFFTIHQNTKLGRDPEKIIDEHLKAEGETRESAYYKREYLGQFAVDIKERTFTFTEDNYYDHLPNNLTNFIISVDLGHTAADAIAILGWSDTSPVLYLVLEDLATQQPIQVLGDKLKALSRKYNPIRLIADAGGLGQKNIDSVKVHVPELALEAALKPHRNIQAKILNSKLAPGYLKCARNSTFATEVVNYRWKDGIVGGELLESGQHSDVVPAVIYGVIAAQPYIPETDYRTPEQVEEDKEQEEYIAELDHVRRQWNLGDRRRFRGFLR